MTTKRFMKFQIILIILLAISLIGNTFSWATRPAVQGGGYMTTDSNYTGLKLETPDYYINGNGCYAVTYMGTLNAQTGEIVYDESTPITSFYDNDLVKEDVHYFKTVITNTSTVTTHVSLFISGYTYNTLTNALIGVSSPVTTLVGCSSGEDVQNDLRPFNLVNVVSQYEISGTEDNTPVTANIEWYVCNSKANAETQRGSFEITDIILTNN